MPLRRTSHCFAPQGCSFFHDEDIADLYVHASISFLPRLHILEQELGDLMNQFLPEGLYPQPEGYTREDLLLAMQQRKILQAAAIKCDERHYLHVALGCCKGIIPRAEAARGHSWRRNAGYCDSVARGAAHMLYGYGLCDGWNGAPVSAQRAGSGAGADFP